MLPRFLTAAYPLELHFLLVPRFSLRVIGFYPETIHTIFTFSWAALNFLLLIYGIIGELRYGFQTLSVDLNMAFKAICPMLTSILSAVKLFFLTWHRNQISHLIKTVRKLSTSPTHQTSIQAKQFRLKYVLFATRLTFTMCSLSMCTTALYFLQSFFTNLAIFLKENAKKVYSLSFQMM